MTTIKEAWLFLARRYHKKWKNRHSCQYTTHGLFKATYRLYEQGFITKDMASEMMERLWKLDWVYQDTARAREKLARQLARACVKR